MQTCLFDFDARRTQCFDDAFEVMPFTAFTAVDLKPSQRYVTSRPEKGYWCKCAWFGNAGEFMVFKANIRLVVGTVPQVTTRSTATGEAPLLSLQNTKLIMKTKKINIGIVWAALNALDESIGLAEVCRVLMYLWWCCLQNICWQLTGFIGVSQDCNQGLSRAVFAERISWPDQRRVEGH